MQPHLHEERVISYSLGDLRLPWPTPTGVFTRKTSLYSNMIGGRLERTALLLKDISISNGGYLLDVNLSLC